MFKNPFSPIFGGKPSMFFGRDDILKRFDLAMRDPGSDDRVFFFTGTRGSGKTALLEQLSIHATAKHRAVIDLGPDDTIAQFIHYLAGVDKTTTTVQPQASVSVLGTGGSISAGAISKTKHYSRESLQPLLLDACKSTKDGLLVTIDEIQKVSLDDISAICNAFQTASRKGHDVMLAVAGLPSSHANIIQHQGCTYLRRASHEVLGLFSWDTTTMAFKTAFSEVRGLTIYEQGISALNEASFGHPYIMQLLGYQIVLLANQHATNKTYAVCPDDIAEAIVATKITYNQRALKPLLDELPAAERLYLHAMAQCLTEDRLASTEKVAQTMQRSQSSVSQARARLIGDGIIAAPERGQVMFCIPNLAEYVLAEPEMNSAIAEARRRRV